MPSTGQMTGALIGLGVAAVLANAADDQNDPADVPDDAGDYGPDRSLPRDEHGNPLPDSDAPHTQLGTRRGRNGDCTQAREWIPNADEDLEPSRDIDFTDHGRPAEHSDTHQHDYLPNPTGGTNQRGPSRPLEMP